MEIREITRFDIDTDEGYFVRHASDYWEKKEFIVDHHGTCYDTKYIPLSGEESEKTETLFQEFITREYK